MNPLNTSPKTTSLFLCSTLVGSAVSESAIVSVNFRENNGNPNQIIAPTTVAGGGAGVAASNWSNVTGGTGSASDLNDDAGAATTLDISWSSGGMWGDGSANTDANAQVGNAQLQRGYLDDNQGGPAPIQINLSQIPYAAYDVVVYFSTDTSGSNYGTITFTDGSGAVTGSTTGTKLLWGENPNLDDTNSLRVTNLSGDLTIDGPVRNGAVRHSISGIQVIAVPEPATFGLTGLGALLMLRRRRD